MNENDDDKTVILTDEDKLKILNQQNNADTESDSEEDSQDIKKSD